MSSTEPPAVLVTGASRGLGAVIAHRLAAGGFEVYAGMRRPAAPSHPAITAIALDVTDEASISAARSTVHDALGGRGLAGLVNNAALLEAGPLELADPGHVGRHLETNVGGPIATVRAFLPLLRAGRGRIVNVSSINAALPLPYWGLYSASKAALDALSDALRMELAPWGVGVTVLTLGAFATDIRRRGVAAWPDGVGTSAYRDARASIEALVGLLDATAADPARVGEAVVEVLRAEEPPARLAVGDGIDDLLALAAQPAEARAAALADLMATAHAMATTAAPGAGAVAPG